MECNNKLFYENELFCKSCGLEISKHNYFENQNFDDFRKEKMKQQLLISKKNFADSILEGLKEEPKPSIRILGFDFPMKEFSIFCLCVGVLLYLFR